MKRDMRSALQATMQDETAAFQSRLAKADAVLGSSTPTQTATPVAPTPKPTVKAKEKARKERVIRDSFTMPENDYSRIASARQRALKNGIAVTKAEILRAGLVAISQLRDEQFTELLAELDKVKTGRPATI
jgi:hypothetical protein